MSRKKHRNQVENISLSVAGAPPSPTAASMPITNKSGTSAGVVEHITETKVKEAQEKYKELYLYASDVLAKEHERFNRADDKAAKMSTMFVLLIGGAFYFDKYVYKHLAWPNFPNGLPEHLTLIVVAGLVMLTSTFGLFLVQHVINVKPIRSRPLDQEVLDFYEKNSRVTIYYVWAKEFAAAYEENKKATNKKYSILTWSFRLMILSCLLLVEILIMSCLYSWC